ncbi:MAG: hypothetical protein RBS78_00870 [Coriobacteriia bacterium]|jgi:hypothetical protein|nr:hypothetical protein [Coriobacteriia bacterium]
MKKNYVVTYHATCTVVVCGAESEDDAFEIAEDEARFGDCEIVDVTLYEVTDKRELEREIRHANRVARDDT